MNKYKIKHPSILIFLGYRGQLLPINDNILAKQTPNE